MPRTCIYEVMQNLCHQHSPRAGMLAVLNSWPAPRSPRRMLPGIYIYRYIYLHVCMCFCKYMYIYTYLCIHTHIHISTCTCIYVYVYTCVHLQGRPLRGLIMVFEYPRPPSHISACGTKGWENREALLVILDGLRNQHLDLSN